MTSPNDSITDPIRTFALKLYEVGSLRIIGHQVCLAPDRAEQRHRRADLTTFAGRYAKSPPSRRHIGFAEHSASDKPLAGVLLNSGQVRRNSHTDST